MVVLLPLQSNSEDKEMTVLWSLIDSLSNTIHKVMGSKVVITMDTRKKRMKATMVKAQTRMIRIASTPTKWTQIGSRRNQNTHTHTHTHADRERERETVTESHAL